MKRLLKVLFVCLSCTLSAVPAFAQLAYQIDVGQNGTFETGGSIALNVGASVTMDIYLSGYDCTAIGCFNCGSDDQLLGTMKYILLDESQVTVSGFPFDTNNGGPWDPGFSGFFQLEPNVYYLGTGNFDYVTVVGGQQKLSTMTLTCISAGTFTLRVANDLTSFGYSSYNDGHVSDCNISSQFPADAVLTVNTVCDENLDCDDGDVCTTDTCNLNMGVCQYAPVICDNGLFCDGEELCDSIYGCYSTGNPCAEGEVCDESLDSCVVIPIPGHTARYERPIPMGVSISPTGTYPYIIAGTAGMLMQGINSGLLFILSNNHVMGAVGPDLCPGTAPFRTPVLQPGTLDIGFDPGADPEYTVGRLFLKAPLRLSRLSRNRVDAAIAFTNRSLSSAEILDIGYPTPEVGQAEVGMGVIKSGRTTAVTTGFVEAVNATVRVNYGSSCGAARFVEQVMCSDISDPGDSGSVILDMGTYRPVALLFAGSATNTAGNPFSAVVEALNVVPVGANGASAKSIQAALEDIQSTMNPRLERLKAIQQKYEESIMSVPGVAGIGIGSRKGEDDYEFIVYCEKLGAELEKKIPRLLDGVPVRLKESGPFEAY